MSAWVNLATTAASQVVVRQKGTEYQAFALQYDASAGHWGFARADTDVAARQSRGDLSTAAPAETWYHLVGTYDAASNAMTLYVNGRQAAPPLVRRVGVAGDLVIGAGEASGAAASLLDGQAADVQVYQHALSQAEVTALYVRRARRRPPTPGPGTSAACPPR